MGELADLKARVAELERENEKLRRPRHRPAAASVIAAVALVLAILLAPVATLGTWARLQLVDTDRFVATFAPLASDPDVQDFVADQVNSAIMEQVDLDAVVGDLFDGLRSLDLPPRADSALALLEAPAARGVASLIDGVVHDLVASDQFAEIWAQSLRVTHERATAIIQDQPGTALQLADDGVLSIDLGLLVERVKTTLTDRGVGIADLIPAIDRTVPIAQADALALVRTVYSIAVTAGYWLPWVVLGLLAVGVLLAKDRMRALFWSGTGLAAVFILFAAGVSIARGFFIRAVSPGTMTVGAAEALFDGLTELMRSTIVAVAFLSIIIVVWAWFAGPSRPATAARGLLRGGFDSVRDDAEQHGLSTGRVGSAVERYHAPIVLAGLVIATVILMTMRPITVGVVSWVALGFAIFLVIVEFVRRPAAYLSGAATPDAQPEPGAKTL